MKIAATAKYKIIWYSDLESRETYCQIIIECDRKMYEKKLFINRRATFDDVMEFKKHIEQTLEAETRIYLNKIYGRIELKLVG